MNRFIKVDTSIFFNKNSLQPEYLPENHPIMEKMTIQKFHGHENPAKFLESFTRLATLNELLGDDDRIVSSFYLHLLGPAQTWFGTLDNAQKDTWEHLQAAFRAKYVDLDQINNPNLLLSLIHI